MIGGVLYIFHRYGKIIAEKYGYDGCRLYMDTNERGGLEGLIENDAFGHNFLCWTDLREAYRLMHAELAEILQNGGTLWN